MVTIQSNMLKAIGANLKVVKVVEGGVCYSGATYPKRLNRRAIGHLCLKPGYISCNLVEGPIITTIDNMYSILGSKAIVNRYIRHLVKNNKEVMDFRLSHAMLFKKLMIKLKQIPVQDLGPIQIEDQWILDDGFCFTTSDFSQLYEHMKNTAIKQAGDFGIPGEIINEYSNKLRNLLIASKLVRINSAFTIAQLSLCVIHLVVAIVNIFTHGPATTRAISLILAITQLLVAIGSITIDIMTTGTIHEIIANITTMVNNFLGTDKESVRQVSMPSIDILISAVCGIIGIAIAGGTMFKKGWAKDFSKNVIQAHRFKLAMSDNVKDARSFIEDVAETCFDIKISPLSKTFEKVMEISNEVSSWLQKPDTYLVSHPRELSKFANALNRAEEVYTSFKQRVTNLESRYANSLNLLFQNIIVARGRLDHLRRLRQTERVKQEPPCFVFVGRRGVGKTTWIADWLIPNIQQRMGWSSDKYIIDFGAQPEFFPPYLGEPVAFFDEFLALKDKDPIVPHLNRICSTEHNIIPGANTYTKEQECLFKVLLMGANTHYVNFGNILNVEAARAMYSRLHRYEVVNDSVPPEETYDRDSIKHTENYTELEFRKFLKPSSAKSTNAKCTTPAGCDTKSLSDPYVIVSKEDVLNDIITLILKKEEEYLKFLKKDESSEKDSMGYMIPEHSKVFESKPVLRNLLDPNANQVVTVPRPRMVVMKFGEEEYTREMLERYLEALLIELRNTQGLELIGKMESTLIKLENIRNSDRVEFKTVLEKLLPGFINIAKKLTATHYVRLCELYAAYDIDASLLKANTIHNVPSTPNMRARVLQPMKPSHLQPIKLRAPAFESISELVEQDEDTLSIEPSTETSIEENALSNSSTEVTVGETHALTNFNIRYPDQSEVPLEDALYLDDIQQQCIDFVEKMNEITEEYYRLGNLEVMPYNHEAEDGMYRLRSIALGICEQIREGACTADMVEAILIEHNISIHPDFYEFPEFTTLSQLMPEHTEQQVDISEHLVMYIDGPPGTGKSTLASHIGFELSEMFSLPLFNISMGKLQDHIISRPSVIVLHDKVAKQEEFNHWYDSLPANCIILNTNNFTAIHHTSRFNYIYGVKEYYTLLGCEQIAGYARRCGLPGYVYHAKQWSFTNFELRMHINVPTFGKYLLNGKEQTMKKLTQEIYQMYVAMTGDTGDMAIVEVDELDAFSPDLIIESNALETLKRKVMSVQALIRGHLKPDQELSIRISDRVKSSEYIFSPAEFVLPQVTSQEELIEVAKRTYASLRRGNKEFTVLLKTPELEIQCINNTIKYKRHNYEDISYSYKIRKTPENIFIDLIANTTDTETVVGSYYGSDIVSCLMLGFHTLQPNTPEFEHAKHFIKLREVILKEPLLTPYVVAATPTVISYKIHVKEYEKYLNMWEAFKNTKMFKILLVIGIVLTTIGVLLTLWGIGKFIFSMISSDREKPTFPKFVLLHGNKYQIEPEVKGATVHFQVSPPNNMDIDTDDLKPILDNLVEIVLGSAYSVGNILGVIAQTAPPADSKKKDKVKAIRIVSNSCKQSMLDDDGHTAVRNKIAAAQVVVMYGSLRMYGLRWKERDVILPAHIVTNKSKFLQVTLPVSIGNNAYSMLACPAMLYHIDYDNDIAVARILDKSIPNAPDITRYFHKEQNFRNISEALLMKRAGKVDEMNYFGASLECFVGNVSIIAQNGKSVSNIPDKAAEFYMMQSCNIPTKAGDCGSPYLSLDRKCNTAMIIGLHTNLSIVGNKSWANVISQEYLQQVKYFIPENIKQAEYEAFVIDYSMITHKDFKPLAKGWEFEESYQDALSELEQDTESDIFYDAETNAESNLVFLGREKKFKPTWVGKPSHQSVPWANDLEEWQKEHAPSVTREGYLALTSIKQHPEPNTLKILGGKPSLVATQIDMISDPIKFTPYLQDLLKETMPLYEAKINQDYGRKFRVLTDFETINGLFTVNDTWYGHLNAMDLDTSAGDYPKRFFKRQIKRTCFQKINTEPKDEYWWKDDVETQKIRVSCANTEHRANEGFNSIHLGTDSLKYELVAKPNKSRVFTCMSLQDVLLGRKYFGTLLSKVAEKCLEGTCSVGIDPVVGFHQLLMRFKKISKYGEAGDFKRWDKHLMAPLMKAVIEDISKRYQESDPDNSEKLRNTYNVLADKTIYAIIVAEGHWYVKMRGNPSGCVLTSVLNSFVNLLMTYMAIVHIIKEHNQICTKLTDHQLLELYGVEHRSKLSLMRMPIYRISQWIEKNFDCAFYGDDKITAISPDYLWLVNFMSFRKFYTNIMGIDYDSPEKNGVYKSYDLLENLSYLSRSFHQYNGTTLAALKTTTVNALLYWSRENNVEQYKALFEVVILEAVLHGEEYYNQVKNTLEWIKNWLKERGINFDHNVPCFEQIITETVNVIQHGRNSGSLVTPSERKREIAYENRASPVVIVQAKRIIPLISKATYKGQSPHSECVPFEETIQQMGGSVSRDAVMAEEAVYEDLVHVHEKLELVFDQWEGSFLKRYHPFPALRLVSNRNQLSIGFTANDYELQYERLVRSDLQKYVCQQVGLKVKEVCIVFRILGPQARTATPIWQVTFEPMLTTPETRLASTGLVLKTKHQKRDTQQSTGADAAGFVEEHVAEKDADVSMPVSQGVARGVLTRAPIWHLNLVDTVHQLRETADSPLSVAMGTAVHTVIDKISYGDVSNFPTAHRWWAMSHESAAPTIYIEYKFISASTIVNQLVVGLADSNKSTYSMEELQQIEGVVLNPQDGTIEVPMRLAAVTTDNLAPTRITMSQEAIDGTDSKPIQIPTLVILTATEIQNAYDNDKVQVNIRKKVRFGNVFKEPWFLTSRSLALMKSILTPAPTSDRSVSSFRSMSEILGLPTGYPLYVTCDGAYIGDFSTMPYSVAVSKKMSRGTLLTSPHTSSVVFKRYYNGGEIAQYDIQFEGMGGSSVAIPLITYDQLIQYGPSSLPNIDSTIQSQLQNIIDNVNSPFTLQNSVLVMTTMGEVSLPTSPLVCSGSIKVGKDITEYVLDDVIIPYAESLSDAWSYTISQFPEPIVVDVTHVSQGRTVVRSTNYTDNNYQSLGFNTTEYVPGIGTSLRGRITYQWVMELQGNNEQAVVVYCGIYHVNNTGGGTFFYNETQNSIQMASSFLTTFNYLDSGSVDGTTNRIFNSVSGIDFRLPTDYELYQKPARVIATKSNATSSLNSAMSRLTFSATLPKTIPATVAGGQASVEVHDDYVYNQLRLLVSKSGLVVVEDQILTFQLYMRSGIRSIATVIYDITLNELYIVNNPATDADRYRTLRKLLAEDIYIGNFRVIEKASNVIDVTDTTGWIDRVVPDNSNNFYTGALISRIRPQTFKKQTTTQAEAMLPLMMGMQQGGNFLQGILQYFMMKQQLNLTQQQKLEQMEKEFQYKLQLQQNQQDFKMKYAGLGNDLAQSSRVGSASSSPGIGFVSGSEPSTAMINGDASPEDNFDQQIGKFRDMLFNSAGLSTPGESVEHQGVGAEASLPSLPVIPPSSIPNIIIPEKKAMNNVGNTFTTRPSGVESYGGGFQSQSNYNEDPMINLLASMPDTIV